MVCLRHFWTRFHGLPCIWVAGPGPLNPKEKIVLGVFPVMVLLWMMPVSLTGLDPTSVAVLGVAALLVFGVLEVSHILTDKSAYSTLLWRHPSPATHAILLQLKAGEALKAGVQCILYGMYKS